MDFAATLVALGIPALVAAIGYASKKWADSRLVREETLKIREETTKVKVEGDADITGRIVIGREADSETIRNAFKTLQDRLDRCEARHDAQEKRHEEERRHFVAALAAKDAQINALWNECRALRTAIEGKRG